MGCAGGPTLCGEDMMQKKAVAVVMRIVVIIDEIVLITFQVVTAAERIL